MRLDLLAPVHHNAIVGIVVVLVDDGGNAAYERKSLLNPHWGMSGRARSEHEAWTLEADFEFGELV